MAAATALHYFYNKQYYSKNFQESSEKIVKFSHITSNYAKEKASAEEIFEASFQEGIKKAAEAGHPNFYPLKEAFGSLEDYQYSLEQAKLGLMEAKNYLFYSPTTIIASISTDIANLFFSDAQIVKSIEDYTCNLTGLLCHNECKAI